MSELSGFKEGDRVRYTSELMPGLRLREGTVIDVGPKLVDVFFRGAGVYGCYPVNLERLSSGGWLDRMNDGYRVMLDKEAAAECARYLIGAYCREPECADWEDVQQALRWALQAFGLPNDFPEQINRQMREEDANVD